MKKRKPIIIGIIVLIIILLGLKMCQDENIVINNPIQTKQVDPNLVELKELINEEELCDDEWAKKILELGKKMETDSNATYLAKYYQDGEITDEFVKEYLLLAKDAQKFATLFLEKKYKEAAEVLLIMKEKFIEIGEYSNETIY